MKSKTCLSIGGGAWDGRTALAAGLSGRINQTCSVRGAASLASGRQCRRRLAAQVEDWVTNARAWDATRVRRIAPPASQR